jgi:hypothetical protein
MGESTELGKSRIETEEGNRSRIEFYRNNFCWERAPQTESWPRPGNSREQSRVDEGAQDSLFMKSKKY